MYPTKFQQQTVWSAITGLSILVLSALFLLLLWVLGKVFGFLQPVLVPLIVAGIIAYLLDPVVRILENRGLSRFWSVFGVFMAILSVISLLVLAVLPAIQGSKTFFKSTFSEKGQVRQLVERSPVSSEASKTKAKHPSNPDLSPALARAIHKLREENKHGAIAWLLTETSKEGEAIAYANGSTLPESLDFFWRTRVGRMLFEYKGEIIQTGQRWLSAGSSKFLAFLGLILGMIMVPIYLFFFLKDSVSIRNHWHEYMPLRASHFKTELIATLQEINGYLISFFRGQVLVGIIDGILVGIALFFFDLPYAALIGVFMAILGIIPYIGNILCLIPACVIGYLHAQTVSPFGLEPWPYVGFVVLIFIAVQQINSLITAPKIVGDSVGLHPLTVIFSMLFWSLILGGFVGALLAVPLTAAVKVILRRYFWEKTLRESPLEA